MINKLSLNEQIYKTLKREIFTNTIKSGTILVNKDLQERFEVSSSPVRDALNRLYQDGLIDKITRSGAQVLTITYEKTREINELMIIITNGCIKLLFERQNKETLIDELNQLLELQKKHFETEEYFYYDYLFHKLFFQYSKNSLLVKLYKQYSVLFEMFVRSLHKIPSENHREVSFESHERIVACFEKDDLQGAMDNVTDHYMHADSIFKEYFN